MAIAEKAHKDHRAGSHAANQENVAELKKGRDVVGELYPILKDAEGKIIDGHHRTVAGFKNEVTLKEVKTEDQKILVRIWANYRREVTESETEREIITLAKALEKRGLPKGSIGSELAKLLPFSERHIRRLLPSEYKQIEKRHKEHEDIRPHQNDTEAESPSHPSISPENPATVRENPTISPLPPSFRPASEPEPPAPVLKKLFTDAKKTTTEKPKPVTYDFILRTKNQSIGVRVTIDPTYNIPKNAIEVELFAV